MYDLVILGGSAAGVTASVYAIRRKLNLILITPDFGGEIAATTDIENWPGENKIAGSVLARKLEEQVKYNNVPTALGQKAKKIEKLSSGFIVYTEDLSEKEYNYETKTIIIASGSEPRHLEIPGEEEFFHKGVTYCAICDAPLFKNKAVAVIGGGNSAITSALMLGDLANQVYLLNVNSELKGETILIDKVKNHPKIKILPGVKVKKILGEKMVTGLEYEDKENNNHLLEVKGIFVNVGLRPNSNFVDFVEKTRYGEIKIDRVGQSSTPGIFAAGDVTDMPYKQIVIASGSGSIAALAVIDFLNKK